VIGWGTVVLLLAALVLLWRRQRFLVILIVAILFSLTYRFVSVAYLDQAGPTYSVQLFRDVGGGWATIPLLLAHFVYLGAFLIVFNPRRLRFLGALCDRLAAIGDARSDKLVSHAWFAGSVLFLILLYGDFLRVGVIPLIDGVERFDYTAQYGGRWHALLMSYGMLWTFVLGVFYTRAVFAAGRTDDRFLILLLATFLYLLLAGHRFSAFYVYGTFFLSPCAALYLWIQYGMGPPSDALRRLRRRTRLATAAAGVIGLGVVSVALYQSYFVTRDSGKGDPVESLVHRVLVQPGELWYATWERVFVRQENDGAEVFDRLFVHPVTTLKRNTTIPYLMIAEIGDAAYPMLDDNFAYGGGYPEVFFEMLGRIGGYAGVFITGLMTAGLFAFVNITFGGMLNFLVNWIFWLKVSALVVWIALERERARRPFGLDGEEAGQLA
jgi:hypothetical protein